MIGISRAGSRSFTGAGPGMGRRARPPVGRRGLQCRECAMSPKEGMAETRRLCEAAGLPQACGLRDLAECVRTRRRYERFCAEVGEQTPMAPIRSISSSKQCRPRQRPAACSRISREEWEKTFNVCWAGSTNCTRAFLPDDAESGGGPHRQYQQRQRFLGIDLGPLIPHTAYSCGKFAVKGFNRGADHRSQDQRATQSDASVVIARPYSGDLDFRSTRARFFKAATWPTTMDARQIAQARARHHLDGPRCLSPLRRRHSEARGRSRAPLREDAPTSAAEAATIILAGVKADQLRILSAGRAQIDEMVRQSPSAPYDRDFFERFALPGRLAYPLNRLQPSSKHRIAARCGDASCGEDDIVELANGCLCCTARRRFSAALSRLIDRPEPPVPTSSSKTLRPSL